jgi:hypothetical protein
MIFVCALKPALLRGSTPYFRSRYGASGQGYQALVASSCLLTRDTSRTRLFRARCILSFLAAVLRAGLSSQWMSTRRPRSLSTSPPMLQQMLTPRVLFPQYSVKVLG